MTGASSVERRASSRALLVAAGLLVAGTPVRAQTVAARDLPRGHVLASEDIRDGGARSTLAARRSPLVGWTTRRVIAAGEVLRTPAIAPPAAVRAGEKVAVVWRDAGIELRMAGTATQDAPVGARVAVKVDARRRLEGTVAAPGLVRIQ
ncbi:flagellar basal body P-ring formation chaperone FlgA [Roseisolibacter sp. H3M3-2]|uniref:flagellar basal body P-ring formation chaperone FlgA n=1 Tax=Roseisolibacter sp. H3M3-2 TaxID=3031323 RepID=UPI0023DB18BA|nr:flagellar basal body P-ring formation chaperone FlgA [Roseisolibacter sp. H3M3-2]MDF1506065.1 flagellar basal body P-ring formation chaperone FlgA [Roseisolibacter sp. H3M3-2]